VAHGQQGREHGEQSSEESDRKRFSLGGDSQEIETS